MLFSMAVSETHARPAESREALAELPYRQKILIVVALSFTLFVVTLSQTVVATAAQNIVADIGGFRLFPWLFAGFSLASAVAVPIVGKLSDSLGRKQVLIVSLVIFVASSVGAGAAQTMPQLLVGRAAQGLGFAGVMGSVWIIMAALWEREDRAKWMGVTTAGFTVSGVVGPVAGGVISDLLSWRWIFFINLPIGVLALLTLVALFPKVAASGRTRGFDLAGAGLFAVFATAALFAISTGGDTIAWVSLPMALLGLLTIGSFAAFIWMEQRADDPVIPIGLFRTRIFSAAMVASLTLTTGIVVVTVFMPLFIQGVKGLSATTSAFPLMTMAAGVTLGANLSGQIIARLGHPRETAGTGLAICTVTLIALGEATPTTSLPALSIATFFLGVGVSSGFTTFTVPVQNAMPNRVLGVVTSTLQFGRVFGMAAASAALGAILAFQITANLGGGSDDLPGPLQSLTDPETLVSESELDRIRDQVIEHPDLAPSDFDETLSAARSSLGSALQIVFRFAAGFAGFGVLMAVVAFTRQREPIAERRSARLEGETRYPL